MYDACVNAFLGESSVSFLLMISTNILFYHTNIVSSPKKGHLQLFFLPDAQNSKSTFRTSHFIPCCYNLPSFAILKAVQITSILGNLFLCNVCLARLLTSDMDELTCNIDVFCFQIMLRCNAASLPQYTLYGLGQRQLFSGNTLGMLHNAL